MNELRNRSAASQSMTLEKEPPGRTTAQRLHVFDGKDAMRAFPSIAASPMAVRQSVVENVDINPALLTYQSAKGFESPRRSLME